MTEVVLASSSKIRLRLLRQAGLNPRVVEPGVNEQEIGEGITDPIDLTQALAAAKAESVWKKVSGFSGIVIGADSVFVHEGKIFGKPKTVEIARQRWLAQRGGEGQLYTAQWIVDARDPRLVRGLGTCRTAKVFFADDLDQVEMEAYLASKEPLEVAGGFTLEGLGSAFIENIEGHPSCVMGLSLPALRWMAREIGLSWPSLWNDR